MCPKKKMVAINEEVEERRKEDNLLHVDIEGNTECISLMICTNTEWKRSYIIEMNVYCQKKPCALVIYGGNTRNLVFAAFVKRQKIKAERHVEPRKVKYVNNHTELTVAHRCFLQVNLGDQVQDSLYFNVVPMDIALRVDGPSLA